LASRKGGHAPHAVGQELGAGGFNRPVDLLGGLHRGAAQHLRVELVRARHDLCLDLEETVEERALVDGEPIAVGLPLEGVADALLPVDQSAVAIRRHPLDVFQLR
jgi:hypothetical protein